MKIPFELTRKIINRVDSFCGGLSNRNEIIEDQFLFLDDCVVNAWEEFLCAVFVRIPVVSIASFSFICFCSQHVDNLRFVALSKQPQENVFFFVGVLESF